ncbi:hypothetical protein, partial [Pontibacter qinzhouensis]|uniref:hypothetical protein n=1 Tax=Pontibacter qinzhouensis TaxID=2603253 RepID=UPI00164EFBA9
MNIKLTDNNFFGAISSRWSFLWVLLFVSYSFAGAHPAHPGKGLSTAGEKPFPEINDFFDYEQPFNSTPIRLGANSNSSGAI